MKFLFQTQKVYDNISILAEGLKVWVDSGNEK